MHGPECTLRCSRKHSQYIWLYNSWIYVPDFKISSYGTGVLECGLNSGRMHAIELELSVTSLMPQNARSLVVEFGHYSPGSVMMG